MSHRTRSTFRFCSLACSLWICVAVCACGGNDPTTPPDDPDPVDLGGYELVLNETQKKMTKETGESDSFKISLSADPKKDVVLNFRVTKPEEGVVTPTSVTFNSNNWDKEQEIVVTGVDDLEVDGNTVYFVEILREEEVIKRVMFQNEDNEVIEMRILAPETDVDKDYYVVSEAGTSVHFAVQLMAKPTAKVIIPVLSSNPKEGRPISETAENKSPDRIELAFTPENWSTPQMVAITGMSDGIMDGDQEFKVTFGQSLSEDSRFVSLGRFEYKFVNKDSNGAGISLVPINVLETSEDGRETAIDVKLDSKPTSDVKISVTSDNPAEGKPSVSELLFTTLNWDIPQRVTISGINDYEIDGDKLYNIIFAVAETLDNGYQQIAPILQPILNRDNSTAELLTTGAESLMTSESGAKAYFSVYLSSKPKSNVSFSVTSSDTSIGIVSPESIEFTPETWNTPKQIIITGQEDDQTGDGNKPYTIQFSNLQTEDPNYKNCKFPTVSVINQDNDVPGITVSNTLEGSELSVIENQTTQTFFNVRLATAPAKEVLVGIDTEHERAFLSSATHKPENCGEHRICLVFDSTNYDEPQYVQVGVKNDDTRYETDSIKIEFSATSEDSAYNNIKINELVCKVIDDDIAGLVVSPSIVQLTEDGDDVNVMVHLSSKPTHETGIELVTAQNISGDLTISPKKLNFLPDNWNVPQTVTILALPDNVIDPNATFEFNAKSFGKDTCYQNTTFEKVLSITTTDTTSANIQVSSTFLNVTMSKTQVFKVYLASQPTADVKLTATIGDSNVATISPTDILISRDSWDYNGGVDVTVTPLKTGSTSITFTPAESECSAYQELRLSPVTVVVSGS